MLVRKRNLLVVLTIITALAIGGASAVLANGNSGNVIYACVNNASGTVKIVAADTVCHENSTLVHWNQEGTPGMDGQPGEDGVDGADGTDGTDGTDGADGVSGLERVVAEKVVTAAKAGDVISLNADCPAGKKTTGGGLTAPDPRFINTTSLSNFELTSWGATWVVTEDVDLAVVFTEAICANVSP
jgi:hypothetical protein